MKRAKFLIRCLFSVALIAFVARKVNWAALIAVLSHLDLIKAALASVLWGVLIAALAFRWNIFLKQQRIELPFRQILSITWGGQFFNSVLPGSTGGDVFKIYQLCHLAPTRRAAAVATVLIDRFSALVALLLFAATAFFIEPRPVLALTGGRVSTANFWWLLPLGCVGALATWIAFRFFAPASIRERLCRIVEEARKGSAPNARVAFAFSLAFAIHFLNFASVYFFARALGIDISLSQVLLMMPVVLLLVMLPVTINGHGLRELLLIAYFSQLSVRIHGRSDVAYQDAAVALSILLVANDLLWSLPGGVRYLTGSALPTAAQAAVPYV